MDTKATSPIRSLCVYCGSSDGKNPKYLAAATELGHHLGSHGVRLVYGGGSKGLMGAVASATLSAGGSVLGIIPEFLLKYERSEQSHLDGNFELMQVPNMHVRKQLMFENADAFVALPGGIGTLEEIVEILTWSQLKRHAKPVALLNTDDFWSPFIELIDHMAEEKFLHNENQARPLIAETADQVLPGIIARSEASTMRS